MKIHINLLSAISLGLKEITEHNEQADIVVERLLSSNKKWGARDRRFIAENIYDVIRYKRLYEFCAETEPGNEDYALKLVAARFLIENPESVVADAIAPLNKEQVAERLLQAKEVRKIRESLPDWLDELGENELAEKWESEIHALNEAAPVCLRTNTLKTTRDVLAGMLNSENIAFSEPGNAPEALVLQERKNFKNHPAYKNGFFEIQDVSSQMVAPFLDAQPGMRVIDACAGAGGKTLHIAALMGNIGNITALDINTHKLDQLKIRAERAGVKIINVQEANESNVAMLSQKADRLLLDVPCSGLGVFRRKPDARWHLSLPVLEQIKNEQASILDNYSSMLKPGGIMVYATCSILPSENQVQVAAFIERSGGKFKLLDEKNISPAQSGFDGFYMARLQRVTAS